MQGFEQGFRVAPAGGAENKITIITVAPGQLPSPGGVVLPAAYLPEVAVARLMKLEAEVVVVEDIHWPEQLHHTHPGICGVCARIAVGRKLGADRHAARR